MTQPPPTAIRAIPTVRSAAGRRDFPRSSEHERVQLTLELSGHELSVIAAAVARLLDGRVASHVDEALNLRLDRSRERLLSVNEVAELVGVSRRTVYRALSSGALAGELVATRWRVRPEAIDGWLRAPRSRAPSARESAVGLAERSRRRPVSRRTEPARSFRERAQTVRREPAPASS
jgi:excisionase family DNA binding protein